MDQAACDWLARYSKIVHPSLVAKKLTGKEVALIAELYDRHAVIE